MKITQLEKELNDCISFLQSIGFSVEENWSYINDSSLVPGCKKIGMLKFENIHEYVEIHKMLSEKRQFSILTFDNTIVYIEYKFSSNKIAECRYIILPDLTIYSGDSMPDSYMNEEDGRYVEMTNSYQLNFPMRIDFDNGLLKDKSRNPVIHGEHSASHIHLGFIEGCRIPISRPISPKVFFKFFIENFYIYFYEENKEQLEKFFILKNEDLFDEEINILDKRKLYFDICI